MANIINLVDNLVNFNYYSIKFLNKMDNYNFLMDLLIGFLFNKYLIMVNSYKGIQIFDQAKKIINIIILVIIIYFNFINFFSILAK